MSLPKLNTDIQFDVKIPSSGKIMKAKPFLVKQEKALLYAQENAKQTGDNTKIIEGMMNIIKDCVEGIDVNKLTVFDIEYLFVRLRSESVGQEIDIKSTCANCDAENSLSLSLANTRCDIPVDINMQAKLTDTISIEFQYPLAYKLLGNKAFRDDNQIDSETMFEYLRLVVEAVMQGDTRALFDSASKEEQDEFLNSLTGEQMKLITDFFEQIPACEIDIKFECSECGHKNADTIRGLSNFFS